MPLLGTSRKPPTGPTQPVPPSPARQQSAGAATPPASAQAVSANVPVNSYVASQIKHSLEFLVTNKAISPYKCARIGALLDAGNSDEELLTDTAKFKPKPKGEEEKKEQGPVATWIEGTLSETLPDLIVTAVGIIGVPLGSVQEEALSALCEQSAPTIARAIASKESRENLGKASVVAAKSSQTAMLKGAKATQTAFKKRPDKSASTPAPSSPGVPGAPPTSALFEPQPLEVTQLEAPDDYTRVYTTTLEPEPGKLLSVMHIYQSDEVIISKEEKQLLDSKRKVPPRAPPLSMSSSGRQGSSSSVQQMSSPATESFSSEKPQVGVGNAPPPPPRHPRAALNPPGQ